MRKEYLKGYIMSLASEGLLSGPPAAMAKKALAIIAKDVPAVLGEIVQTVIAQSGEHVIDIGVEKMRGAAKDVIRDVSKRGFGPVWNDVLNLYWKGVESKNGRALRKR